MTRFALDIETVPRSDEPDFADRSDWEVFAIVLGHERGSSVDVDVLFRDNDSLNAEAELYARSLDWIDSRTGSDDSIEILTYNGSNYDIPILEYRVDRLGCALECELPDRVKQLKTTVDHVDLLEMVLEAQGYRMPIEDCLAMLMIDYDVPRWPDGRKASGEDMLDVGPRILDGDVDPATLDVTRRYAAADVRPLFAACDALERRLEILDW